MLFFGDEQNVKCYEWYCLSSYQNNVTFGLSDMHTVFVFLAEKVRVLDIYRILSNIFFHDRDNRHDFLRRKSYTGILRTCHVVVAIVRNHFFS